MTATGGRRALAVSAFAAVVVGWALLAAWLAHRLAGLALDDFFITYRYAWNLAAGHGLAFNPGERVFGTTEPGLALLLAGLALLTRMPIPALGTFLTAAALVAGAALLLAAARERGRTPEAIAGGTLALTSSFLWVSHGAAAPLVLCCLLLAARRDPEWPRGEAAAGLLAGLAVWLRPDAAVGTAILGVLLWTERRRLPWRYGLAVGAVIATGAAAAWRTFGSVLPQTGIAKHAMATAAGAVGVSGDSGARFWPAAFPLLQRHWGALWIWIAVLGLAGLPALAAGSGRAGRAGRLLALYAVALAVAYPLLGVPFFIWYAFPIAFAALYGAAFAAGWAGRAVAHRLLRGSDPWGQNDRGSLLSPPVGAELASARNRGRSPELTTFTGPGRRQAPPLQESEEGQEGQKGENRQRGSRPGIASSAAAALVTILLLLPACFSLLPASVAWFRAYRWFPYLETYRRAALYVHQRSTPADAVAYVEIGVIGYYGRQPVVDLLGLVTPGSIPYVEKRDLVGAFLARPTTWVLFHTRGRMRPLVNHPWFQRAYEGVARFDDSDGRGAMTVYRRRPGVPLPPAGPPGAPHGDGGG